MTLTEILLTEAEANYSIAEHLIRRVSDEELQWAPSSGKNWMTMAQLLMHLTSYGCGKAVRGFVTGDWGMESDGLTEIDHVPSAEALPSVEAVPEALELLAADRTLTVDSIKAVGEADLLGRTVTAPWGGPELPLFQQLLQMIAHLAQHKGQLFYYLKLMGQDVNTSDLWGA
jgi:uncharacterized damage-inducible protein DinB